MPLRRPTFSAVSPCLLATALVLGVGAAGPLAAQPATAASTPPSPESAEIQRLIKDGQHDKALKLIDESLAKNPKDPQMRFRRGVALSMLDRKAEALAVFQKLVEDHPDMPAPYNNMAVILGAQGDYEKARQALEKAIRTNPAYATAYQNLGDVYAQLASQAYTKALQLDKADTSVQPKLALLRELTSAPNVAPASAAATPAPKPAAKPAAAPPAPAPVASPAPATVVAAAPTAPKPTAPAAPAPASAAAPKPAAAVAVAVAASVPPASKPVAVAAAPASAPTTKPATPPAPAAPAAASADVEAAVRAWAAAWSKRDVPAYYAAYTPDFRGQAASRKAWEQDRRDRIAPRKQIKVELQDLKVTVDGDQATARFKQVYASDTLSTAGRKTLQLVRANGRWLIKQEAVGG